MSSRQPVNLKERIAALEQRNASSPSSSSSSTTTPNAPPPGQLKAKIEKFEKKGGVPVPRGRFGLGVPPPLENQPAARRGELYGNRIPQPVRSASVNVTGGGGVSANVTGSGRAGAIGMMNDRRAVSLSTGPMLDDDAPSPSYFTSSISPSSSSSSPNEDRDISQIKSNLTGESQSLRPNVTGSLDTQFVKAHTTGGTFQPSFQPLKPHVTGGAPSLTKRGTEFAAALEKARKLEMEGRGPEGVVSLITGESQFDSAGGIIGQEQEQELEEREGQEQERPLSPFRAPSLPSIVVSPDASFIGADVDGDVGEDVLAPEEVPDSADVDEEQMEEVAEEQEAEEWEREQEQGREEGVHESTSTSTSTSPTASEPSHSPQEISPVPSPPAQDTDRVSVDTVRPTLSSPAPSPPSALQSYPSPAVPLPPIPSTPTISISLPLVSSSSSSASTTTEVKATDEEEEYEEPPKTSISEIRAVVDQALAFMESVTPLSATFSNFGSAGSVASDSASSLPSPEEHVEEPLEEREGEKLQEEEKQVEEQEIKQPVRPLPLPPSPPRPLPVPTSIPSLAPAPSVPSPPTNTLSPTSTDSKHTSTTSAHQVRKELYLDLSVPTPLSASFPRSALASSDIEGDYGVGVGDLEAAKLRGPKSGLEVRAIVSPVSQSQSSHSSLSEKEIVNVEPQTQAQEEEPKTPTTFLSPSPAPHTGSGRPVSMYELSPSKIEVATRHTPATSRGVPVFVPGSAKPRKSDFVWFPPTPGREGFESLDTARDQEERKQDDDEDKEEGEEEGGMRPKGPMRSATIHTTHKPSASYSMPSRYLAHYVGEDGQQGDNGPPPPSATSKPAFTAIVHRKKRQLPVLSAGVGVPSSSSAVTSTSGELPERKPEPQRRLPETPAVPKVKQMGTGEVPATPGYGELATLLKEAVLLEDTLMKGELPGDTPAPSRVLPRPPRAHPEALQPRRRPSEDKTVAVDKREREREKERERKEKELDAKAAAWAREQQIDASDDVFTSPTSQVPGMKLRHTFLIPLSKAMTLHRKEGSTVTVEGAPSVPVPPRPKSAFGGEREKEREKELPNPHPHPETMPSLRKESSDELGYLPQKKSPRSRFPSFKRLASGKYSSSSTCDVRHSNSTSSELSVDEAVTPPDPSGEFGSDVGHANASASQSSLGHGSHGSTSTHGGLVGWPSLSPKKSHGSIGLGGRASSFAEKMWSRARTKSSTSTLSTYENSDRIPESIPESMAVGLMKKGELPPLPPIPPSIIAPEYDDQRIRIIVPPTRSTSLQAAHMHPHHHQHTSGSGALSPQSEVSETPSTGSTFGRLPSPQLPPLPQRESLLSIVEDTRPESWMSNDSSLSSLPSPLLPQELYDAFPSVPQGTPLPLPPLSSRDPRSAAKPSFDRDLLLSATVPPSASVVDVHSYSHSPLPTASAMTPSFDQELLSSAVHLSSARESGHHMRSMTLPPRRPVDRR